MAIISKETYDKFTQEEKENIQSLYRQYKDVFDNNKSKHFHDTAAVIERGLEVMDMLIGEENLQPKPKIKTWEDVIKLPDYKILSNTSSTNFYGEKIIIKTIATMQIAKLIELGYGGMVTEEDNKDQSQIKYFICPRNNGEMRIIEMTWLVDKTLGFYSRQQAEEFLSYPENRELVEQYYLL